MKMKMKKAVAIMLALTLTLGVAGCSKKEEPTQGTTPTAEKTTIDIIKEKGKLVVGTSADYPPYEFHIMVDGKDKIVGSDVMIAEKIAEKIGVELDIQDMPFDGLIMSLKEGKFDLVIAGLAMTEKRKEEIEFSTPYIKREQKVIIRGEDKDKYTSFESLTGKSVGAQKGTVQETVAKTAVKDAKVVALTKYPDLILELQNSKIDAMVSDGDIAEGYVKVNTDLVLADIVVPDDEENNLAVGIKKGNQALTDLVNVVLQELIDSGDLDKILEEGKTLSESQQ